MPPTRTRVISPALSDVEGPALSGVEGWVVERHEGEPIEADAVVLINRVKPHTDFESVRVGSGLVKMAAIGLGKVEGAAAAHRAARRHGYEESIFAASHLVRSRLRLLAGVALLEDPHHRLAIVEVVPAAEIGRASCRERVSSVV